MSRYYGVKRLWRCETLFISASSRRALHHDGRNRMSRFWAPTQFRRQSDSDEFSKDAFDLLLRAGFLRQTHSGIFHLLPLGLRVQDKIEQLIDKHMQSLGASKVSLSSLSSRALWEKSGRLQGRDSELFQLTDRKDARYLLSPTHEEEITMIVKNAIHSHKDLPLRLYQVSRKYRDEARPRQGLLRGREFVMKDLYTFDVTEERAMKTYDDVRAAYGAILDEINLPYLVANADSGNMGGSHSHEYHFVSTKGEDTIIKCGGCGLSINEELYAGKFNPDIKDGRKQAFAEASGANCSAGVPFQVCYGIVPNAVVKTGSSTDMSDSPEAKGSAAPECDLPPTRSGTLVKIFIPEGPFELNSHALKRLMPGIDTSDTATSHILDDSPASSWSKELSIRDPRIPSSPDLPADTSEAPFTLTKAQHDDLCPSCGAKGTLEFQQAVEIGHTFHLGTRYSTPFGATVNNDANQNVALEMGCHGIGVSRLMGAVAALLVDDKGLNWPVSIAPFTVLILGTASATEEDISQVYDLIASGYGNRVQDAIIDDRETSVGWKLNDADFVGYPFIVVLGKAWAEQKAVELQCRRLGIKEKVALEELVDSIRAHSAKL